MASHDVKAWLTYMLNDDMLNRVLALIHSIRNTKSIAIVQALFSRKLSIGAQIALQNACDLVYPTPKAVKTEDDVKTFAFSLDVGVDKFIFVSPNSLVMENCDEIFEDKWNLARNLDGSWTIFGFCPNLELHNYLVTNRQENFQGGIHAWMESQNLDNKAKRKDKVSIWKLCLENGQIEHNGAHNYKLGIVCIVSEIGALGFKEQLTNFLARPTTGFIEKVIILEWIKNLESSDKWIPRKLKKKTLYNREPIAIVGMSCRVPGAENLEDFWNLSYSGSQEISNPRTYHLKEHHTTDNTQQKTQTETAPSEVPKDDSNCSLSFKCLQKVKSINAQAMVPHEIILEALAVAGINPQSLRGSNTGLFTGSWSSYYLSLMQPTTDPYVRNGFGAIAGRLSLLLGFTTPGIAVDAGCSSTMVAVTLALNYLNDRNNKIAIVAGENLNLNPYNIDITHDKFCSTERTLREQDPLLHSEGCGVLVLKRLSDAIEDNDNIWAVIRGSAVIQDQFSETLWKPTVESRALAMECALKDAGVTPDQVGYVGAHYKSLNTDSSTEILAIGKVYRSNTGTQSLLSEFEGKNIWDIESCSGLLGIIKILLALQHQIIPKHLNLVKVNPVLDVKTRIARKSQEPVPWPKIKGQSRLAGVSSFGVIGKGVHVILEEAPDYEPIFLGIGLERPLHIIKFSCKSPNALNKLLLAHEEYFRKNKNAVSFADAAYTANVGRASMKHRAFIVAKNSKDAANILKAKDEIRGHLTKNSAKQICFLFAGEDSQYLGMAKRLYETSPVFGFYFDKSDYILRNSYNLSIRPVLWEAYSQSMELSRVVYSHACIFVIEYCLLQLWKSWGIKPDFVLGHGLGEFCAAVAAGAMDFENALRLVVSRSQLLDGLPTGSMLKVKANLEHIQNLLQENNAELDIAAVNSLEETVLSGENIKVDLFKDICLKAGIASVTMQASHAYYSRHVHPILEKYKNVFDSVQFGNETTCKYISAIDGQLLETSGVKLNQEYWLRHTRQKVNLLAACNTLEHLECEIFVDVGVHPVLSTFVMKNIKRPSILCCPSLRQNSDDWHTILNSVGNLYLSGCAIDWESMDKPYRRRKCPDLPAHPTLTACFKKI